MAPNCCFSTLRWTDTATWCLFSELYYRDADLCITEMNGPRHSAFRSIGCRNYDHIFDFEDRHYVELENGDALESMQLHMPKAAEQNNSFGEVMTIGTLGAARYL